jgi:hypothetical protein
VSIDWGSVPGWIAGVGAATALYFARAAALYTRKAAEEQAAQVAALNKESQRNNEIERKQHASKVAVYIGSQQTSDGRSPIVRFVNSGDLPIYGITVFCFTPTRVLTRRYYVIGPQTEKRTMSTLTARLTLMFQSSDPRPLIRSGGLVAACSFRDAVGAAWFRDAHGTLHGAESEDEAARLARASAPHPEVETEELESHHEGVE